VLTLSPDPLAETRLVAALGLVVVDSYDPIFRTISGRVAAEPKALRGISGRPAQLRLRNGAQLEYLYLLTTQDGRSYIITEYAYG
jgi:hypothetical protein